VDKRNRQSDTETVPVKNDLLEWTSNIVTAYLNKNEVDLRQLPHVMETVYAKLSALGHLAGAEGQTIPVGQLLQQAEASLNPATIENSIMPDYIVCLEDGMRLRTLKRYLFRKYHLTPEQYRHKWGLPPDYPMVAPNYAAKRSALAKKMGLGKKRKAAGRPKRKRHHA
jgi:predicted transcriptional regulator